MPSAKLTALADLAGGQVPTDLCYIVDVSAGTSGSKKSTLNDFLQEITQNITDKSVGFAGGSVATVSAASKGKIRYNEVTQTFQASRNTAAYINFVVGSGSVTQVTVWNTSTDEVTGYASLIYDDSNKLLRLFASSFLPTMQVENSSATDPAMIRAFGGSGRHQVYNFGAAASVEMYRGTTGPTFPGSGADVGQIIMAPANSTSVNPTTVGGARILTTTTQATVLGVGGGVGMVIETAGNNETSRTRRFLINQHGCVVVGANGQGITGTYGGTSTNVVLGQLTTYNANAAIQCGNPFTGNDNITFLIQANSGQTQAIFQLQTSAGASLYSVGSSGSHTYIGIGGGVAVSPANQGRIYYDTVDQAFKVSQNGGSYRNMVFTAAGVAGSVQYNNGSNAVDGDTGFVWDSPSATLILGDASVLSGKILFRNSTNANTLTLQPGATGANITLTLPTTDGNAGEFLQTDGSGVLSWAAGGGSPGGSGSEVQFRGGASTFSAVTGSSVSAGQISLADYLTIALDNATTAAADTLLDLRHSSSGTPAANFGAQIRFGLESTTTANQDAATIAGIWTTATHASRSSAITFNVVSSAAAISEAIRVIPNQIIATSSTNYNFPSYSFHQTTNTGLAYNNSLGVLALVYSGNLIATFYSTDGIGVGLNRSTYIAPSTATGVALTLTSAANSTVNLLEGTLTADDTNAVAGFSKFVVNSNGTAATGLGGRLLFGLESSTTNAQDAAAIDWIWTDATHASRTAKLTFSLVGNAAALATVAEFDMDTTAGNTRFLIYDVDNATLERVSVGAADSGGAGFKLLRIPN